jgi:hypothetical protein
MAQTGVVKKSFPYAVDGVNIEHLAVGRILSFPDGIFTGLEDEGYIEASDGDPENSVDEAKERDGASSEINRRLMVASDQELKDIIARSGTPVSGNLVHAHLVEAAKAQLTREADRRKPVLGVDPNSGVTEQPLAAPGAPTPPSAADSIAAQQAVAEAATEAADGGAEGGSEAPVVRNQLGDALPERRQRAKKPS